MSQPIGNDPFGNGDATNPFGNGAPGTTAATGATTDALSSAFGPLTTIFAGLTAGWYNGINAIANTGLYGICTIGGFIIAAIGLMGLTKDVPILGGIGQGLGKVAKKGAEIAGLAAFV